MTMRTSSHNFKLTPNFNFRLTPIQTMEATARGQVARLRFPLLHSSLRIGAA